MSKIDQYYTSQSLARRLISYRKGAGRVEVVADFAAGEGALLDAAKDRFPSAKLFANDICRTNCKSLSSSGMYSVSNCDFRLDTSTRSSPMLRQLKDNCDLITLNPPFSSKNGSYYDLQFGGVELKCSIACYFLFRSLTYLKPSGELLCILPEGVLFSNRDSFFWRELGKQYVINYKAIKPSDIPCGWNANAFIVSIRSSRSAKSSLVKKKLPKAIDLKGVSLRVQRGNVDLTKPGKINGHGLKLIHTTDIENKTINSRKIRRYSLSAQKIKAPAVIIARVCNPSSHKIGLLSQSGDYNLSDCVFALEFRNLAKAKFVFQALSVNWASFSQLYQGTCAKYLTKEILLRYLRRCNCQID